MSESKAEPKTFPNLSLDEFYRKCHDVFPMPFDGIKLMVNKPINSHFQVSHTLNLQSAQAGYRFGSTYVGQPAPGSAPTEAFPVLLGDMDLNGNTSATMVHQWANGFRVKCMAQTQKSQLAGTQFSLEKRGRLTHMGLTVANPSILTDSGTLVAQYVRRVTENLDLGVEFVSQAAVDPTAKKGSAPVVFSVLSYGARYTTPFWTLAANVSTSRLLLNYFHKQTERIQFGVEFESNLQKQETKSTVGWQIDLPDDMTFRASADTDWVVTGVMEKKLSRQIPFTLCLSAIHNLEKNATRVGLGLIIGS
ncbi:eukaryotic porin domain-containing protein [Ditylenchus destructor]|uniref:Eukaryotic porin domain-containing protein n=1 Tax=Ditylenchus destructor TaxID=166010 RepID=A0AAD4R3I6_9BILA|nr:eukaryotic porin domain-containing protein [Ditylenchus destructor]